MKSTSQYQMLVNGEHSYNIAAQNSEDNSFLVDGEVRKLDLKGSTESGFSLILGSKSYQVDIVRSDYEAKEFILSINGLEYVIEAKDRFDLLLQELGMENLGAAVANDLKAPMPGLVLDIRVKEGQEVKKGDALIVLEAMKMENVLKAEGDAVVASIQCEQGKAVEKGQVLIGF